MCDSMRRESDSRVKGLRFYSSSGLELIWHQPARMRPIRRWSLYIWSLNLLKNINRGQFPEFHGYNSGIPKCLQLHMGFPRLYGSISGISDRFQVSRAGAGVSQFPRFFWPIWNSQWSVSNCNCSRFIIPKNACTAPILGFTIQCTYSLGFQMPKIPWMHGIRELCQFGSHRGLRPWRLALFGRPCTRLYPYIIVQSEDLHAAEISPKKKEKTSYKL